MPAAGSNRLSAFVDGGGADGFPKPTVCAIAIEVSIRASKAIVVISFRMMDFLSGYPFRIDGSGRPDHKVPKPHVSLR